MQQYKLKNYVRAKIDTILIIPCFAIQSILFILDPFQVMDGSKGDWLKAGLMMSYILMAWPTYLIWQKVYEKIDHEYLRYKNDR